MKLLKFNKFYKAKSHTSRNSIVAYVANRGKGDTPTTAEGTLEQNPNASAQRVGDVLKDFQSILQDIQNNAETYKVQLSENDNDTPSDMLSPEVASTIVEDFARKKGCDKRTALVGIAKLVQDGGANASKTNLKRKIGDIEFDIADLRSSIQYNNKSGTVRKLAKTLRSIIASIASLNDWPGPLTKDLMRAEPQLQISSQDAIYCNEIHSDNYDPVVPPQVREALQRREIRFREKSIMNPKNQKPRKKQGKKK